MNKRQLLPLGMISVLLTGVLLQPPQARADTSTAPANPPVTTMNPVYAAADAGNPNAVAMGACQLVRDDSGLSLVITTSKLTPLDIYTAWWMILNPDGTLLLLKNATGTIALPNGTGSFVAHLATGPLPAVDGKTVLSAASGASFTNPRAVTVRIVIRDHGPVIPSQLADQLTTYGGGCDTNACSEPQFSVNAPP